MEDYHITLALNLNSLVNLLQDEMDVPIDQRDSDAILEDIISHYDANQVSALIAHVWELKSL